MEVNSEGDKTVFARVNRLVSEEHELYRHKDLSEQDRQDLEQLKVQLDQCWDLLRQRQALREFGQSSDRAKIRPPEVVENYEG